MGWRFHRHIHFNPFHSSFFTIIINIWHYTFLVLYKVECSKFCHITGALFKT